MTPQEAEELAALWTGVQPTVAAFIRTLAPHTGDVEELLQRTAVTLVRKHHEFDHQRPFAAWAIGVAKLEVFAFWRERHNDRHVFDNDLVEEIAEGYRRVTEHPLPVRDWLLQCIAELDGRAHEAIRLRYAKQLKTLEIAETMGLSAGAARVLLTRARTSLRTCMEERQKRQGN
jgi:RNA polymerase sigma-70 factor, ECF subfamily